MEGKLFVCNTYSDNISVVDLELFKQVEKIELNYFRQDRIGPCKMCFYENKLLVANKFNRAVSIVNIETKKVENSIFIGTGCNDIGVHGEYAYIMCSDANNLVKYNLKNSQIEAIVGCGDIPCSIDLCKSKKIIIVANANSDTITLVDYNQLRVIKEIKVGSYPLSAKFSIDGNSMYICESNIGLDQCGSISIFSINKLKLLYKIPVGKTPVNMFIDGNTAFVTNFGDGTVSVIDLNKYEELYRIEIGGMPKDILAYKEKIYVGDVFNNKLFCIDKRNKNISNILLGREPSGIMLS